MSKEVFIYTGLRIMEDEQVNGGKESLEKSSPLGKHTTVVMTVEESVRRSTPDREIEKGRYQGLVNLVVHP